jgi:hypothetical protein
MPLKTFFWPYPRFILLDKTRIWLKKGWKTFFESHPSVRPPLIRPSATHPSVRTPSIRPYPRFILTQTQEKKLDARKNVRREKKSRNMKFKRNISMALIRLRIIVWFCKCLTLLSLLTDRCKHCGSLRFHVPTFFQATVQKMINCACSASLKWVVIRSSSNQMHASSNLPSMRTKKWVH